MESGDTGKPWTEAEIDATVDSYFEMFLSDMRSQTISKERTYKNLALDFPARTPKAFSYKMRNISAALVGMGYPHLRGLKPLDHYQKILIERVIEWMARNPSLDVRLNSHVRSGDPSSKVVDIVRMVPIPVHIITDVLHRRDLVRPYRRNYLELEAQNSQLGLEGELAVVRYEQNLLRSLGKHEHADRVEHVALTLGDGLGFDVLSYHPNGLEKWIEVKTTRYAEGVPFYLTNHELEVSKAHPEKFNLYRLFNYGSRTGTCVYSVSGSLYNTCMLTPLNLRATPKGFDREIRESYLTSDQCANSEW